MLIGLYLLTPLLRVMVAHFTDKLYKYFICVWFIGVAVVPLIEFVSGWSSHLHGIVFLIPLYVGYFVIGPYLVNVKVQHRTLAALTILGVALTAIGTFILAIYFGGDTTFFLQDYFSPTVILATLSLFMLLNNYAKPQLSQTEKLSRAYRIMRVISENTLPIYLLHMIIIYALQNGFFFGFTLNGNTVHSIIGIPLMTALTLGICLIIIIPLKKIPGIRKLIG